MWKVFVHLSRLGGMQSVIALAAIVRNKLLAIRLGAEGFGEFSQILLIASTASVIVGFGLELSLNRNIAAARDHSERQRLLAQANAVNLTLSVLVAAGLLGMLIFRPNVLTIAGVPAAPGVIAACLALIFFIPIDAAARQRVAFLTALMDIKGLTAGRSLAIVCGTALTAPIVWFFGLAGAAVQVVLISAIIVLFLDRRCRHNGYAPWMILFDAQVFKELASFGVASLLLGFLYQASDLFMRSILIRSFGPADNGIYQSAIGIVSQVKTIVLSSVGSYSIAVLSRDSTNASINATANLLLAVVVPVATIAFGLLGLFSGLALVIAFSEAFLPAQEIMPLLLFAELLWVIVWVLGAPLLARKQILLWVIIELLFLAVRTASAVWLIPRYGAMGLAGAYLIGSVVHLATTSATFAGMGFYIERRHIAAMVISGTVVAGLGYWGSLIVFDVWAYLAGSAIAAAYAAASLHVAVGLPAAWARASSALSKGGSK